MAAWGESRIKVKAPRFPRKRPAHLLVLRSMATDLQARAAEAGKR